MNAVAIAKEYFPEASDCELEGIIWERTGFPGFWEGEPEESLRVQLKEFQEATRRWPSMRLCWNCNSPTLPLKDLCLVCLVDLDQTPLLTP